MNPSLLPWATLLVFAFTLSFIGCGDDNESDGSNGKTTDQNTSNSTNNSTNNNTCANDPTGKWILSGWLSTQDAYYGYLTIQDDLSSNGGIDLSKVTEFEGDFTVSSYSDGTVFVGQDKSTIEKWELDCDQLVKTGEVSLLNQGVTSTLANGFNHIQRVSDTKAYYIDKENFQVIVFNPETMTTTGTTIDLKPGFGTPDPNFIIGQVHRDGDTFIVTARSWDEDGYVVPRIPAAFIDSTSDTVTFDTSERCGNGFFYATDTAGNLYVGSHPGNVVSQLLDDFNDGTIPESCIVRINKGATTFDPSYHVNLDELLGGPSGNLINGSGDQAFVLKYTGPTEPPDLTIDNYRPVLVFGETWEVYSINLGDEENSLTKVNLPGPYQAFSSSFATSTDSGETTFLILYGAFLESGQLFQVTGDATAAPALEFDGSLGPVVRIE